MTDLTRSLSYPFRGPAWLGRIVIGALLEFFPVLFAMPIIVRVLHRPRLPLWPGLGLVAVVVLASLAVRLVVLGYLRRVAEGVLTGEDSVLPAWDRFPGDFLEGLKLVTVTVGLWLPAVAIVAGLTLLVTALAGPNLAWVPIVLVGPLLALATLAYLPAALLAMISDNDTAAAFDVDRVNHRIGRVFGAYVLAFVFGFAAEIVAQLGLLICCVGIFATRFAAHCAVVHAFASVQREAIASTGVVVPGPAAPQA